MGHGLSTPLNITKNLRDHWSANYTDRAATCYSENLVAPGIEPRTSGLTARNFDHETTEANTTRLNTLFKNFFKMRAEVKAEPLLRTEVVT
jgi:hypothetical protein